MYPIKKRKKAIELLIKYDHSIASVIAELGYPSRGALRLWYKQYLREQLWAIHQSPTVCLGALLEEEYGG